MKKQILLGVASLATVMNLCAEERATLLYENFSTSGDTFPEGWEVVNSTPEMATLQGGVFSWRTAAAPGDFPAPVDGDRLALIYHASYNDDEGKRVELSQDEWLITPAIDLGSDARLTFQLSYVPMFLYNCSNEYIDPASDPLDFKERVPATTLKVMVKADGESEWTETYDVFDLWQGYTLNDLMSKYYSRAFRDNEVSLEAYSGKKIRLGFRFTGYMGNAMALDAVKVTSEKGAGIEGIEADSFVECRRVNIINTSGVVVGSFITGEGNFDPTTLAPGFYILASRSHTSKIAVR